jgi:hypothetical protein
MDIDGDTSADNRDNNLNELLLNKNISNNISEPSY